MKRFYQLTLAITTVFTLVIGTSHFAFAQGKVNIDDGPLKEADWFKNPDEAALNESHADNKNWITQWYGPDGNYENNEGFQKSGPRDLIEEGTKGKLTQQSLSTLAGLKKTQTTKMAWGGDHGGTRNWTVFELDPASQDNMNRGGPADKIDTYVMCVIAAPKEMKAVMSPAHDDHAQIWINGDKWYNNTTWTGGAQVVNYNVEVKLKKVPMSFFTDVAKPVVLLISIYTLTITRTRSAKSILINRRTRKVSLGRLLVAFQLIL